MFDTNEMVTEFSTEAEAQVALEQLREEGVEGQVMGVGGELVPVAPFRLFVVPEHLARARQILDLHNQEQPEPGWEDEAEAAVDGWICSECDTQVALADAFCPECGSSRANVRAEDEDDAP